eukprot:CAMPEP_0170485280 /NCGR_PEP_ID=MMETSP0208-20121228/4583_1 /TAXON_ID=197538 /ORGANISM="Strombidium inclinatum, Strain S3" /LENGTH=139 /DNA_ID=CAMNT_0010758881 /DNA_START=66 /DNA_END=485 /DNA_ORIENTATION=+
MASHSNDFGLLVNWDGKLVLERSSNLLAGLKAVHERHVTVHKDNLITSLSSRGSHVVDDSLESLLAVQCCIDEVRVYLEDQLKYSLERHDIEGLVVDDENSVLLVMIEFARVICVVLPKPKFLFLWVLCQLGAIFRHNI